MARLGDIPQLFRQVGPLKFIGRVKREVDADHVFAMAAALAYSWLFAIFPFMVFLLGLLPYLPERVKDRTKAEIRMMVYQSIPSDEAAGTIWNNVNDILSRHRGGLLGIGLLVTIWGASGGMNMTLSAMDRCYELDRARPFYRQRPFAILLTVIVALLVISIILLIPVGTILINWLKDHGQWYVSTPLFWIWRIARYPLAVLAMFSILNILYHFGPAIRQSYSFITPGALFCVVVWVMLGLGFRYYIESFSRYNETYGTLGGVVILLLLFYLNALVLLIGAEINSEIDYEILGVPRGSRDFRRLGEKPAGQSAAMEDPAPAESGDIA